MLTQHADDRSNALPRGIPWARWFGIALAVLLVLTVGIYWWVQNYITITVAADTTYLTTPLLPDGYPDYLGYWNAQNSAGVTAENNAWVAVVRCLGPREIDAEERPEYFRLLGIAPLPEEGEYLLYFGSNQHLEQLSDELLISASVAAQLPFHVRFARLAALNCEQHANGILQNGLSVSPQEYFVIEEWLNSFAGGIAERIELTITEPDAAAELARQEGEPPFDPYRVTDEEQIQDLRSEALDLLKPQFLSGEGPEADAEQEAAWRRQQIRETGQKLLEREDLIISERAWTEAECPLAADWIRRSSPLLDKLQRELAIRPKFYAPLIEKSGKQFLVAVSLDHIQFMRQSAIAFSYRSRYYIQRHDRAAALRDIRAIFEISRCHAVQPCLVEGLVAVAVQGIGCAALVEWLQQPDVTDEELAQVASFLEQAPPLPTLGATLAGERLFGVGTIVSVVARAERSPDGGKDTYWETSIVCWDEVLREMNRMYDTLEQTAQQGNMADLEQAMWQAFPARPELKELHKQRPWYLLPSQRTEVAKHYYPGLFQPAGNAARNAFYKAQVRLDLSRVYVALLRYHRANQSYPAALTELVPAYLPAVPTDPFDGQPLKYQRQPKGGYRAWSIWSNGVDDGGTPNVGDDEPDFMGNDLVIGSPDEIPPKYLLAW